MKWRRFEVLRETHLGPLQRNINVGDIILWDAERRILILNGYPQPPKMRFEEAITIFERQMVQEPNSPLVKELSSVECVSGYEQYTHDRSSSGSSGPEWKFPYLPV